MRRALVWSLGAVLLVLLAVVAAGCTLFARADTSTVGKLSFENELWIPPLLEPREVQGRTVFRLTLQEGTAELVAGRSTDTWGVNGPHLGPTLRASRGDRVELRVRNELPERTTLHWHGMHLPPAADGGPHQVIEPGATWTPSWRIDQPAATLWYHPHPHGDTADHLYRGIAGFFILDDAASEAAGLPDEYGVDDVPLLIQDKRFDDDGSLDLSQGLISPLGRLGDEILVNGTRDPHLEVTRERVRLRLLNGSPARAYEIGFADGRRFDLVATDGGLLDAPQRLTRVPLSPGERAEIVVAFEPGEEVVLRSFEPELGADFFNERFAGGDDSFDLLEIRAAPTLGSAPGTPRRVGGGWRIAAADAERTRRFELSGTSINGKDMDMNRIDEVVRAGSTELWEVENTSGTPHSFHPHDATFRVLEYAGAAPPAHLTGPKDTVYVPPGRTVRLLVRVGAHADPEAPLMFHCHILQHEDRGMMGQFVLTDEPA